MYWIAFSIEVSHLSNSYPLFATTSGANPFNTTATFGFTNTTFVVTVESFIFPFSVVSNVTLIYPAGFSESSSFVFGITSANLSYCAVTVLSAFITKLSSVSQALNLNPVSGVTLGLVMSANFFPAFGFT